MVHLLGYVWLKDDSNNNIYCDFCFDCAIHYPQSITYWKDSLKIFSIATLAYLVFIFSLLRTGGKHANEIILTAVIVIIVWSMAYIYAHMKDK